MSKVCLGFAYGNTRNRGILVGGLRNARRSGVGIAEQAELANVGLAEHIRCGEFVTGQLGRIDLRSGNATIVNAGHPPPLRLRDGVVTRPKLEIDPAFAINERRSYRAQPLELLPGDRLLFVTDGLLDRTKIDIAGLVVQSAAMHPREAVQHLIQARAVANGRELASPIRGGARDRGSLDREHGRQRDIGEHLGGRVRVGFHEPILGPRGEIGVSGG